MFTKERRSQMQWNCELGSIEVERHATTARVNISDFAATVPQLDSLRALLAEVIQECRANAEKAK